MSPDASLPDLAAPDLLGHDLVIFDNDGVLVDSERLTVNVESRLLTELGWPLTPAEVIHHWMGRTLASELAEVAERLGEPAAEEFERRLHAELADSYEHDLRPVEGVVALVEALAAAGVPLCVASSGTPDGIAHKLARTGLAGFFGERTYSGVEVEHGKPAPDLFLHAAARMGVAPERCAVVEDSVHGCTGAVAAGMTVFGYAGGLADRDALAATGAVLFDSMADLLP